MSIGSETNGGASSIRIKSNATRGGLVTNSILMDTHYSFSSTAPSKCPEQDRIPVYNDITLCNIRILDGGKITLDGFDAAHKLEMRFDNVIGDAPGELKMSGSHVTLAVGPSPMNLPVAGEDVTVTGARGAGSPNSCANKFVPFPGR
jgi:polygalacturonase